TCNNRPQQRTPRIANDESHLGRPAHGLQVVPVSSRRGFETVLFPGRTNRLSNKRSQRSAGDGRRRRHFGGRYKTPRRQEPLTAGTRNGAGAAPFRRGRQAATLPGGRFLALCRWILGPHRGRRDGG